MKLFTPELIVPRRRLFVPSKMTSVSPQFGSVGTHVAHSTSTTCNVPIPSGVTENDIILVNVFVTDEVPTVTPPDGQWTEVPDSPIIWTGSGQDCRSCIYWKRQTSATGDGETTGSYTFTISAGLSGRQAYAIRYTGCATSGSPFDVTTQNKTGGVPPVSTPPVSDTTTVENTLLVWMITSWNGGNCAPPTDFSERMDSYAIDGYSEQACADKPQASATGTGSLTGTISGGGGGTNMTAWLGALKPL